MAAHPHHCHHIPPPITTSYCCHHCCNHTSSHYSPPQPPPTDPLLQSIASHLLLHHHPPSQPQPHPHHYPPTHQTEHQHHSPKIYKHKKHSRNHRHQESDEDEQEEEEQTLPHISSLLRRISVLESSLRHHHAPPPFSLRDAAARTIQTHFRAFLIRRSRTLRQLKDLAFIKSSLTILKSDTTHFDYHVLSRKAMGLLVKLESIQGGDPMIRDGKRSIGRELNRFLEFIDEVSLERQVLYSSRGVKNVGFGRNGVKSRVSLGDHRKKTVDYEGSSSDGLNMLEKLRNRVQKIEELSRVYEKEKEEVENNGVGNKGLSVNGNRSVGQNRVGGLIKRQGGVQAQAQTKVKKNVSFVENGNVYRIIRGSNGSSSSVDSDNSIDESDFIDGERELVMNHLCKEVEEIRVSPKETEEDDHEEEDGTEETESTEVSGDEEKNLKRNARTGDEDNSFRFSAPLPLKMEDRDDLMNKKQPLR